MDASIPPQFKGRLQSTGVVGVSVCCVFVVSALNSCRTLAPTDRPSAKISEARHDPSPTRIVRKSGPELLSFDELAQLAENPSPTGILETKLDRLFSTPIVNNEAYFRTGVPSPQKHPKLGAALRISTWNIEKSIRIAEAAMALRSESNFEAMLDPEIAATEEAQSDALRQRHDLAGSDVLLLQEMDLGHCRSGYHFAADYLANELKMNYAYAPQQLELDPIHLGFQTEGIGDNEVSTDACEEHESRYRGVFGVAVLSRFPIKRVQLVQLANQPYDWYHDESKKHDLVEKARKLGSSLFFKFRPVRERKIGGRAFTRVDLHVPRLPHETLTIINIHLEIKTTPKQRRRQMDEILNRLRDIKNPVVMAGDFNSSYLDVSATSLGRVTKRASTDLTNIAGAGLYAANITGPSQVQRVVNGLKNFRNPLAWHIPVVLPNKVKGLFDSIEDFRFADGGAFDFRGDRKRSLQGTSGTLSNSNQRHRAKGFTFTYSVPRPIGPIGRQRLDWIFVKSFLTHPRTPKGAYRLAPHFGETLSLVNRSLKVPISDHDPITTVLPLNEPNF